MTLHLGKAPASYRRSDLQLAHYRDDTVEITIPKSFGHEKLISDWGMLGNGPDNSVAPGFEGAGDCVFAGAGHEVMLWNKEAGVTVPITGAQAIADYSTVTGYVLDNESTDNGTDVHTALDWRTSKGDLDANNIRHKLSAYVALEPGNWEQLREAAYLFSAVGVGINFPQSAMDQFNENKPWTLVTGSPIVGGHYIPCVGAYSTNYVWIVTWGETHRMGKGFYEYYNDESYALLSTEFLKAGKSIEGYDLAQLEADLNAL